MVWMVAHKSRNTWDIWHQEKEFDNFSNARISLTTSSRNRETTHSPQKRLYMHFSPVWRVSATLSREHPTNSVLLCWHIFRVVFQVCQFMVQSSCPTHPFTRNPRKSATNTSTMVWCQCFSECTEDWVLMKCFVMLYVKSNIGAL